MKTSLVLIFIGAFTTVFLGILMGGLNDEVKGLEVFMEEAKTTQPNFEKSLEIYTDQTEIVINYLLDLRPSQEAEYVDFISRIEDIGRDLSLNLDMESVRFAKEEEDGTLNYMVTFQGGMTDLENFLEKLEGLPYYIKVKEIDYRSPKNLTPDELEKSSNIKIKIGLFTK
ncbi:hypothetical protein HON58_01250 [Candidatus Peregrinibacteria bacterium]|nr:hypothetical protein [Candidatus Peregrinibacteria bacterium]